MNTRLLVAVGRYQAGQRTHLVVTPSGWHPDDDGDPAPTPEPEELPTAA